MAGFALINLDKREVVVASETGFGYKMVECIGAMPLAPLRFFTIPVDGQPAPPPPPFRPSSPLPHRSVKTTRVPVGHWANDRILIVNEYSGSAEDVFPVDVLSAFPDGDSSTDALYYAFDNLKHVNLPGYEHQGDQDALFPVDKVWVVHNLTKKWYARSDKVVAPEDSRGLDLTDDAESLGLGDLIWAGDRFDVQTLQSVQNSDEEWKDWSKQAK
ncbi:hypothetical protein FB45DRAFT_1051512 [Roridomyces roridus]|uniref:Uncharacterized protein n=1 Tax=Roridomyces roridus TaxID=1738132 RepID=A0AAD7FW86_9AGAR|nr:hypothetical protein FB45DRAFT_1051512 [Roridomyces roridus]